VRARTDDGNQARGREVVEMRRNAAVWAMAVLVTFAGGACSTKSQRRHYEKEGGFSYDPPAEWQIVEFPGLKYHYFFEGGNRKYVLTCSALAEDGEALDAVFEESAMTFRIH
jgi:hypothetical protein